MQQIFLDQKKKENKTIKDKIIKDIRTSLESEIKDYYKLVRIFYTFSNNYIEYESISDKNKTLSTKEYPEEIQSHLKDIINNLKMFDRWRNKLLIAINFMSSKGIGEKPIMHSKTDNIAILVTKEGDEAIKELFKSKLGRIDERQQFCL